MNHVALAIAAPSFGIPSETFIRDHVRSIAPGATVLICQDAEGAAQFSCPVLSGSLFGPLPRSFAERVVNAVRRRLIPDADARLLVPRVAGFLKAHAPKAVLAEYGTTGCALAEACQQAGVPLYVHFHGYDASQLLRDPRQVEAYRALFPRAAGIIVPSDFLGRNLMSIGCPSSKVHVNSFGIDTSRFTPTRFVPHRLLAVGRLVEKKAPHLTIEAFSRVALEFADARLDIVGGGPLEAGCKSLIRERGLEGRVHMHGVQDSEFVAGLMREAAIFVQHSVTAANGDTEGLPVAILEAMASGLAVVSTRHSGIPEAVVENGTGLLVDEHDVDGMAAAIRNLLADSARAAAMGAAGRARLLENFTQERSRDRLCAIMGL